ncbi:MAG: hypothetical protein JXR39_13050 [Marinilabiliaceae bacterium]|nr:hypothetical protein [Marinilabiliaceae bacterium]
MKRISNQILMLFATATMVLSGCSEKEWSEDYDISWPVSKITQLSAQETVVGDVLTIIGENMNKVSKVYLNGKECEIVANSATETQIQFKVARRASTGVVSVRNAYKRLFEYETPVKVTYPEVVVAKWPAKFAAGEAFSIEGENVDLITEVRVGGKSVIIDNPASMTKIVVATAGLGLVAGTAVDIEVKALGNILVNKVTGVSVEEPSERFDAVAPIVLWSFEEGDPITEAADVTPDMAGRNLGGLAKARGQNYYSVIVNSTGGWTNFMYIDYGKSVDLSEFHDPHITFLVNTNGKTGYINPFMTQDGSTKDNHLTNANASERAKYGDDYKVTTNGWEWRSYPISKLFPDFNPTSVFDNVKMRFTSGNVGNGGVNEIFEIHVDQIMITDGLQLPAAKVFDFEGDAPEWEENLAGATAKVNAVEGEQVSGSKFYQVSIPSVAGSWKWMGAIGNYNAIDLSTMVDPHLSFQINTGSAEGMIQFESFQNNTKWGGAINTTDYKVKTDGWVSMSIRLDGAFGNWGGDATAFDPTMAIDYLKLGFTTGNIESGAYEVRIDDVYISDGPMW